MASVGRAIAAASASVEAGTTADNELEMDQLANEAFASTLIEITDQIGEWAGRVKGR